MKTSTRILLGLALGLLSAALQIFAFQPYTVWPLAFIALVPADVAAYRLLPPRYAGLAPGIAIATFLGIFLTSLFGVNPVTGIFLAVAGLIGFSAVLSVPKLRAFHERTGFRWFILQGAVEVAGIEMIRSYIPPIYTHAFWAQTMYTQSWMLQGISVFSVYGLSFVVVLVNFAITMGLLLAFGNNWRFDGQPELDRKASRQWMTAVAAIFLLWAGFGVATLISAPKDAQTVRVAAIQHGFAKPGHMDPDTQLERLAALSEQTRLAAGQGAHFIVWPELSLGFDPQVEHTNELQALAAETNAYILISYGVVTPADEWRNEAVLLTPSGEFAFVYGKNFNTIPGEPPIVTAGTYPVLETEIGNLSTIICNDVNFTVTTRTLAKNGAQIISVPTLETGAPGLGWEQRTQIALRAVENRVAIVKADAAGISMIVDPYGRIVAHTELPEGVANSLVADVALGTGGTPYIRLGDWMGWTTLVGFVAFSVVTGRKPGVGSLGMERKVP
jgi:apolipoprotein N-acyltransferase